MKTLVSLFLSLLAFLSVLAVLTPDHADAVGLPILSDYTQQYKINGQLSSKRRIRVACNDNVDRGVISAGAFEVEIQCNAPEFPFVVQEVSSVPFYTGFASAITSQVGDIDQFIQNAQLSGRLSPVSAPTYHAPSVLSRTHVSHTMADEPQLSRAHVPSRTFTVKTIGKTGIEGDRHFESVKNGLRTGRRKLLISAGQGLLALSGAGALINAIAIEKLQDQVATINDKLGAQDEWNKNISMQVSNLDAVTKDMSNQMLLQTFNIDLLANKTSNNSLLIAQQAVLLNQTQENIIALSLSTRNDLDRMKNETAASLARLANYSDIQFRQINYEVALLTNLTMNMSLSMHDIQNYMLLSLANTKHSTRAALSMGWDQGSRKSTIRSKISALFETLDVIIQNSGDIFALVQDEGTRPHPDAITGSYSRYMQERVGINWVEVSDPTHQNVRTAGRYEITFYTDTVVAINNNKPWIEWDDVVALMGPAVCLRPFADTEVPSSVDPIDGISAAIGAPGCLTWVEVVKKTCLTQDTAFVWTQSHTGFLDQVGVCASGGVDSVSASVIRTKAEYDSLMAYIQLSLPFADNAKTLKVSFYRNQKSDFVQLPKRPEDATMYSELAEKNLDYFPLHVFINKALTAAFPLGRPGLLNREQFVYGRAFSDVEKYNSPECFTPTIRSPDPNNSSATTIQYDGGAVRQSCKAYQYRYVSARSVEFNVASPFDEQLMITNIDVLTVAPVTVDQPIPVTTHDVAVTTSTQIEGSHLLPATFSFFGSLDPYKYGYTWDVPEDMTCKVNSYWACRGKVDFYQSRPGVRATPQLKAWINEFPNATRPYRPSDTGESLSFFARTFAIDDKGYPQCNVPGGILPTDLTRGASTTSTPKCRGNFDWFEATALKQEYGKCNGMNDPGTILYTEDAQASSAAPVALFGSWSFSFQYDTLQQVFTILTMVSPDSQYRLTIQGGANIVVTINGATVSVPVHHETDDSAHTVWIQFDPTAANQLTIFSDLVKVYQQTGFTYTGVPSIGSPSLVIFPTGGGTPSITNRIYALRQYASVMSEAQMVSFGACQYSKAPWKRCDVPMETSATTGGFPGLPDDRTTLLAYQVANDPLCDGAKSYLLTDGTADPAGVLPGSDNAQWTLTFWSDRIDFTSSYTPVITLGGWTLSLSNTGLQFSQQGQASISAPFVSGFVLSTLHAHHIAISATGSTGGGIKVYIDRTSMPAVSGSPYPILATSGSQTLRQNVVLGSRMTYARFNSSQAFDTNQLALAMKCDATHLVDPAHTEQWRTPLATCTMSPTSAFTAYCRHPSMCEGRCSAYTSSIDAASKTFKADYYQCDAGYKGNRCEITCPRFDNKTYCLPDINVYSNTSTAASATTSGGIVPGSIYCNILKHFQVRESTNGNGQRIVTLKPRRWSIEAEVDIPQGDLITNIVTGACPIIQPTTHDNQTIDIVLTNSGNTDTYLRATWTPSDPNNADITCSNLYGASKRKEITVDAHNVKILPTPPCVDTSILIERLIGTDMWEACGKPIQTNTFSQVFATSVGVLPEITSALVAQRDNTFYQMNLQLQQSFSGAMDIVALVAKGLGATDGFTAVIQALSDTLKNQSMNAIPFSVDGLLNLPISTGDQSFIDTMRQLQRDTIANGELAKQNADVSAILASDAQIRAHLNSDNQQLDWIQGNLTLNQKVFDARIAELDAVARARKYDDVFGGLGEIIPGIAKGATAFFNGVLGIPLSIAGGLGSSFSSLFHIALFCVVGYFAFQWWSGRQAEKRMTGGISNAVSSATSKYKIPTKGGGGNETQEAAAGKWESIPMLSKKGKQRSRSASRPRSSPSGSGLP